ncbi:MAG TPA: winged helix-turn-helix transcriptional regulator [Pseudonocardia sp.]|nr:winged helix-turn-helix transcriptional regulator [Pseudonocardia sp.]
MILMAGPRSFGQLGAALPELSDEVLTERLAQLRRPGLVHREVRPGFPSRVSYALTEAGRGLRPLLVELYRAGERLPDQNAVIPISHPTR